MTTSLKKTLLAALVVPAIALTAACTSGSDDNAAPTAGRAGGGTSAAHAPAAKPVPGNALAKSASGSAGLNPGNLDGDFSAATSTSDRAAALRANLPDQAEEQAPDQNPAEPATAAIISKGQISLHSKDIDQARFDLQQLLDRLDGTIDDEQSDANKSGRTIRQRLVLRVPSKNFARAMDGISRLDGVKLVSRSRSSKDVTTQVIDTATRVRTQKASLARVRALLARATSLREIISIESQLSRRQADLDSLEAQQKYLADQTSLSTITVYLTVPDKKQAAHHAKKGHDFFSGLRSGWDHLGTSTNAVLTGVGAVLPFAVLIAVIGFPAWTIWRRRRVGVAQA